MNSKKLLQALDDRQMDRKDFLKYAGIAALGVISTKTVLGVLLPESAQTAVKQSEVKQTSGRGFGRSRYGV